MKAIKITESNAVAIEFALKTANGYSESHAYTTYSEVASVAMTAENMLASLICKKDFPGARYTSQSGSSVPNSYKGVRNGTEIVIERRSSAWYLVNVRQFPLFKNGGKDLMCLTPEQNEAAITKLQNRYVVR